MKYIEACQMLLEGKLITHKFWPKNQFIYSVQGSEFTVNRAPLDKIFQEGTKISYKPHIDICYGKDEQGKYICGVWLGMANVNHEDINWEIFDAQLT